MEMEIWILNHYTGRPGEVLGARHVFLAEALVKMGHQVLLGYASDHHHRMSDLSRERCGKVEEDTSSGVRYVAVEVDSYQGNGVGRLKNLLGFAVSSKVFLNLVETGAVRAPDIVLASSPTPLVFLLATSLRRRFGGKVVFEVRDLWPESLVDVLGKSRWSPAVVLFGLAASYAYRSSDAVTSLLPASSEYLRSRTRGKKVGIFPNGLGHIEGDEGAAVPELPAEIRDCIEECRRKGRFLIGYTGSMGPPNGLGLLLDLQNCMGEGEVAFQILLVGDGTMRAELEARASNEGLEYLTFLPRIPRESVRSFLGMMDANFACALPLPIYRYGISFNKIFEYMFVGRPLVFAGDVAENPVSISGGGVVVPPGDPTMLLGAIERLIAMDEGQRRNMGSSAKAYVEQNHNWETIGVEYGRFLEDVVDS